MGMLPEWWQKGSRPMGSFGQYTQSNMFTNPTYEQQGKAGRLANALMNPSQQPQMQAQGMQQPMGMQGGVQPQNPAQYMANTQNTNLMLSPNQNMQNWASQYQGQ